MSEQTDLEDYSEVIARRKKMNANRATTGSVPKEAIPKMDGVPVSRHGLAQLLRSIEANDQKYEVRHWLICFAVSVALRIGILAGFRIDTEHKDWPVAYIELPTGQVTWHCPPSVRPWDGHTTEEKYQRINAYCKQVDKPYDPRG